MIKYVGNKMNFNEENVKLSVESIRVHYFFSEDVDIEKFLNETDIKMRLTHGNDWNCFVSEGSTNKSITLRTSILMGRGIRLNV